jgi:hypothetical protein
MLGGWKVLSAKDLVGGYGATNSAKSIVRYSATSMMSEIRASGLVRI